MTNHPHRPLESRLPHPIPRRTVMKQAAWAVPIVAVAAAAPAVAASTRPQPTLLYSGGTQYHWGTRSTITQKTVQVLNLGAGQVTVNDLPAGTTVTSITIRQSIERREGQTSRGPGALFAANPSATFAGQTSGFTPSDVPEAKMNNTMDGNASYNIAAIYPVKGSGFDPKIQASNPGTSITWADGITTNAWHLTYEWSAARNQLTNLYSGTGDARSFTTGSSGRYNITYRDVNNAPAISHVHSRSEITAHLSDGTTLTRTYDSTQ